ncbi:MAG: cytochrome c [Chitinophagales bacterium]
MDIDPKKLRFVNNLALLTLGILMILGAGLIWGAFTEASQIGNYKQPPRQQICGVTFKPEYTGIGRELFQTHCQKCHLLERKMTGPALALVRNRWADSTHLYSWIKNSQAFLQTGDKYANDLAREYSNSIMPAFPNLTDEDIYEILLYTETY